MSNLLSGSKVLAKEQWFLIGEWSTNSLIVLGGSKPICIRVSHNDGAELLRLISDANAGIAANGTIHYD